jgi:hypothetical protein
MERFLYLLSTPSFGVMEWWSNGVILILDFGLRRAQSNRIWIAD